MPRLDEPVAIGDCELRNRLYRAPLLEGGVRDRERIDDLLGDACENCNNCTVPQVTGASGVCRTPSVLVERGRLEREEAYERD